MQVIEPRRWQGHYFDGRTPTRHEVTILVTNAGLQIEKTDGSTLWWPYDKVRQTEDFYSTGQVRLEKDEGSHENLVVSDPAFLAALQQFARDSSVRFHDASRKRRQLGLILLLACAAALAAWVLYSRVIPAATDLLAAHVPVSWEEKLGRDMTERMVPPEKRCANGELAKALDAIQATLLASETAVPYVFHIAVVDDPTINAYAVTGGYIVVFRGLLEKTRTPEELAGVLAHEMQHILKHHPTRAVLRRMSMSGLISIVAGKAERAEDILQSVGTLGELSYSRQDEQAADRDGIKMLQAARIDPAGLIDFLSTMDTGGASQYLRYLSTHPETSNRIREIRRLAGQMEYTPRKLVPGYQWMAVRQKCE